MAPLEIYLSNRKEINSESMRNIVHTGTGIPGMAQMDNMETIIRNMFTSLDNYKTRLYQRQRYFKDRHPSYQIPA